MGNRLRVIAVVVVIFLMAGPLYGRLVAFNETLGTQVAQAGCVIRGVVTKVEPAASHQPGVEWAAVTVETRETLRGPEFKSHVLLVRVSEWSREWIERKSEQLFLLGDEAAVTALKTKDSETAIWADPVKRAIDPSPAAKLSAPLVTDELRRIDDGASALAEVRRVIALMPAKPRFFSAELPTELTDRTGNWGALAVMLREDVVVLMREWLGSSDLAMQWWAAELLIRDRTPENAEALRKFAWSMPTVWLRGYDVGARARLLAVLHGWGVKDLPPLVRPSAPVFDVRSWSASCSLASLLALSTLYVVWRRRRVRVGWLAWCLVVSAVVVLAVRSYWPRDAVTWGNIDVAWERGTLYVEKHKRADQGFRSPLMVCTPADLLDVRSAKLMSIGSVSTLGDLSSLFLPEEWSNSYAKRKAPLLGLMPMPLGARFRGPIWAIPTWLILALLSIPILWTVGLRAWRYLRARQARGFPVVVAPEQY